jgi:DnaJ family protein C protein 13
MYCPATYQVQIWKNFNEYFSIPGTGNISAAKAEIIDALKNVCRDLTHGEKIAEILKRSPIWAQYKDQRHDLFLPASQTQAITAGSAGSRIQAITAAPSNNGGLTDGMFEPPRANNPPVPPKPPL